MLILEDYISRYTSKVSIDHQAFRSLCRDHHQWYRQVLDNLQTWKPGSEHALNNNHDIHGANTLVVDSHPHLHPRCALEAWHIRSQKHSMNREQGLLPQTYNSIIYSTSFSCASDSNYSPLPGFCTYKLSVLAPVCTNDDRSLHSDQNVQYFLCNCIG